MNEKLKPSERQAVIAVFSFSFYGFDWCVVCILFCMKEIKIDFLYLYLSTLYNDSVMELCNCGMWKREKTKTVPKTNL